MIQLILMVIVEKVLIINKNKGVIMKDMETAKAIDKLILELNLRLASYIDGQFYLPLKEELKGTTHSLGFKKELLKEKIESELENLKKELKEVKYSG